MDKKETCVNLQSMIDTHDHPFVLIGHDFRIVAVNRAYERAYGLSARQMIGQTCYQVSHHNSRPCFENGEDCPHESVYGQQRSCTCTHVHYDDQGHMHRVRVRAYPVQGESGEIYMGEILEKIGTPASLESGRVRMVGHSEQYQHLLEQLKMASDSDAPVLLQGETGTGKDLAANYIHQHSGRADKPFLTLDCTVLTEALFEAEVFGYERGAFTGSVGEKAGLLEAADGGTVFLDEIGEIPLHLQSKLLRVLETGEFRRVGGRTVLQLNARIVCATNRELTREIQARGFRQDLYYRIACLHINVPPLRERLLDIPCLTEALLEQMALQSGHRYQLGVDAIVELQSHDYPGNVRELRNILRVAAVNSKDRFIDAHGITSVIQRIRSTNRLAVEQTRSGVHTTGGEPGESQSPHRDHTLREVESEHISRLLEHYGGNRRKVAGALGICERTLYRKLNKYSLS